RMRVGIGRPPGKADAADHVLARFSGEERQMLNDALDRAVEALEVAIVDGVDVSMNRFNAKLQDGPKSQEDGRV
ncbi:MAG TPA: aminoacyl-tRNA hydrolase, partial [bacterium]|nr:aminoacyl-tRNA hydrolase [bacterium]